MSLDINTAGTEFVKSVLTLYRSAKYFREKEILAKKLLDYSIEAGRLVTELGTCFEHRESEIARNAMEELKKALYVLKVMSVEGIYPQRRVQPVNTLGESIKELVDLYIVEGPHSAPPAPPQYTAEPEPAAMPAAMPAAQNVPQLQQDNNEQLSLLGNDKENDGGFNDIYYGTI